MKVASSKSPSINIHSASRSVMSRSTGCEFKRACERVIGETAFRSAFLVVDYFDTRENHWISSALHKTPRGELPLTLARAIAIKVNRDSPSLATWKCRLFSSSNPPPPCFLSVHLPPKRRLLSRKISSQP